MQGDVYKALAEAVRTAGGIDIIGVCDGIGRTGVLFSGAQVLQRYVRGRKKVGVTFNITGASDTNGQAALVQNLSDICENLRTAEYSITGFDNAGAEITSYPAPIQHDDKTWIYSARVQLNGYIQE